LDSLLIDAAEGGFLGEVMRLVDLGADVDATDIKVSYVCKGATRNCIYVGVDIRSCDNTGEVASYSRELLGLLQDGGLLDLSGRRREQT
jgi:hypothetical protein